jgi:branched-chain amino acid transport system permease protein
MTAYLVTILIFVEIAVLLGFALNLQWGICGMVNFGLAGFFALGAYTAALVALAGGGSLLAVLAAACVCAAASAAVALISLRLSEEYLAILTLGFSEVVGLVALSEDWLTGGSIGLSGIPRPLADLVSEENRELVFLGLLTSVALGIYVLLELLLRSPFGRTLRSIREDATVAATLGKNVPVFRMKAFAIGGAVIGVAGAFHAFYLTFIDPSQFTATITGYTFMAVVIGGRGSNLGLVAGAAVIMVLIESTRFLKDAVEWIGSSDLAALRLMLVGAGLILVLIYRPQGFRSEHRLKSARLLARIGKALNGARPIRQEGQ